LLSQFVVWERYVIDLYGFGGLRIRSAGDEFVEGAVDGVPAIFGVDFGVVGSHCEMCRRLMCDVAKYKILLF